MRQHCRKNPDFRSEFPSGKVARRSSSHALESQSPALALTGVLWQQPPRRDAPSPHSEFELSWPPGHTPAVDGDSGLPFPLA